MGTTWMVTTPAAIGAAVWLASGWALDPRALAAAGATDEILAAQKTIAAATAACDAEAYGRMMADDGLIVFPDGTALTKAQRLAALRDTKCRKRPAATQTEMLVRQYGDVAVVTFKNPPLEANAPEARATRVLHRTPGGWRAVATQVTEIAKGKAAGLSADVAAGPVDASAGPDPEKAVRAALTEVRAANLSHDQARVSRNSGDDYVRIDVNGAIQSKSDFFKNINANPGQGPTSLGTISDLKVQLYGPVAITTSVESGTRANTPPNLAIRVFVRRDGRWLLVQTHWTRVTHTTMTD